MKSDKIILGVLGGVAVGALLGVCLHQIKVIIQEKNC
jgi:phage shock protein PspC (stress-responsive transcriptional regulator)